MTVRRSLVTALAVVAAFLGAAPAAQAARGMEVALADDPVFLQRYYYDRERALSQARELGVTRIRVSIGWAAVLGAQARSRRVPADPAYDWSRVDDLIDAAARHGIRVQAMIVPPAPAFATGDREIGVERPNPRLFADFARAVAEHFKGRIARYSIWNEPDHTGWLTPQRTAAGQYRELYRLGYAAVKRADPRAQVLIGELVPFAGSSRAIPPLTFLRQLTCTSLVSRPPGDRPGGRTRLRRARSCPRLRADGIAHHAYDYMGPPERRYPGLDNVTIGTLDRMTSTLDAMASLGVLRRPNGKPLDVYVTEFGFFGTGRRRHPDIRRASYLRRSFQLAQRNPRVKQMLQYLLVRPPEEFHGSYFDMAIVGLDGEPMRPYTELARWTRSAGARGLVRLPGGPLSLPPRP